MMYPADPVSTLSSQRQTETSTEWMLLVASSVLIHLGLFLAIGLILARTPKVQFEMTPIAFEVVQPSDSTQVNSSTSPTTIANNQPLAPAPTPAVGPVANSQPLSQPDGPVAALPSSVPQPAPSQPPTNPGPSTPVPPATPPVAPPSSAPLPSNPPSGATGAPPANPPTQPSAPAPVPNSSPSGPVASGVPLPDVPGISPESSDGSQLPSRQPEAPPSQTQIDKNPIPAEFSGTITGITAPLDVPDIPKGQRAQLQGDSPRQNFVSDASGSGCLLTPAATNNFNQEVVLRIAVDGQGKVIGEAPVVQQSSGNPAYDQLAVCALQSLLATTTFKPAYDTKEDGQLAYRSDNLDVRVLIAPKQ